MATVLKDAHDTPRCPEGTWNEMAANDARPAPDYLLADSGGDHGAVEIDVDSYTDPAFFKLELEKMWPNVWQYAAREEEMLDPGDIVLYDNAGRSYILVRQEDGSVRAFHNSCLHRGRKLRLENGWAQDLTCPFHAFSWNLDGTIKNIPCRWDFPKVCDEDMQLPEAEVGRWGGYIFIRENPGGPSLEEYLAPLSDHFREWRHEDCYTVAWAAKVVHANWKVTAEAFLEAWHTVGTHPQIMPYTADAQSKYAAYGNNVCLHITAMNVPSAHLQPGPGHSEQKVVDAFMKGSARLAGAQAGVEPPRVIIPEGQTARAVIGEYNRKRFSAESGRDLSHVSDSEVQDAIIYNVFPNFGLYGGFAPNTVYRFRPWHNERETLMEMRLLKRIPKGEECPPAPPMKMLAEDETWGSLPEFGLLGEILDQDMGNMQFVHEGLEVSKNRKVVLGEYQEMKIRQLHRTLNGYVKS